MIIIMTIIINYSASQDPGGLVPPAPAAALV